MAETPQDKPVNVSFEKRPLSTVGRIWSKAYEFLGDKESDAIPINSPYPRDIIVFGEKSPTVGQINSRDKDRKVDLMINVVKYTLDEITGEDLASPRKEMYFFYKGDKGCVMKETEGVNSIANMRVASEEELVILKGYMETANDERQKKRAATQSWLVKGNENEKKEESVKDLSPEERAIIKDLELVKKISAEKYEYLARGSWPFKTNKLSDECPYPREITVFGDEGWLEEGGLEERIDFAVILTKEVFDDEAKRKLEEPLMEEFLFYKDGHVMKGVFSIHASVADAIERHEANADELKKLLETMRQINSNRNNTSMTEITNLDEG
jgi:hypothetical protein